MKAITILGITGSLREGSYNSALLDAVQNLLPEYASLHKYPIETLPFFNPDLDLDGIRPETVEAWKKSIASADAVVIVSPEYAHALPGVLKNALDWVVGSGELVGKPVAALNATPTHLGAQMAHESLIYLIRLLSAELLEEASFTVDSVNKKIDTAGRLVDIKTGKRLQRTVRLLLSSISA